MNQGDRTMKYRFKRSFPPHAMGDPVPDSYTPGVIATMLEYGRIEPLPDVAPVTDPAKAATSSPADKMVRAPRVARKGVA